MILPEEYDQTLIQQEFDDLKVDHTRKLRLT